MSKMKMLVGAVFGSLPGLAIQASENKFGLADFGFTAISASVGAIAGKAVATDNSGIAKSAVAGLVGGMGTEFAMCWVLSDLDDDNSKIYGLVDKFNERFGKASEVIEQIPVTE